ncbi:hypothetical protein IM538_13760 [Cytobacillus suaedae]|nr:hypothetical protein IM538_13760 [Cytobacillus suaedae]
MMNLIGSIAVLVTGVSLFIKTDSVFTSILLIVAGTIMFGFTLKDMFKKN